MGVKEWPGAFEFARRNIPMPQESLSQSLNRLLETRDTENLCIGEVFDRVGDKGFGLLLVVMSLPSALPVPAPGYSTPFGIILSILGIQMIMGQQSPWLPARARRVSIKRSLSEKVIRGGAKIFGKIEHLIRPRWSWIGGRLGLPFMGTLVLLMSALMILPIPLTNTAPAMVIFLIGAGLTEDDGLVAGAACALGVLAVLLYAGVIYLALTVGFEGVAQLKELLF